MYVITKNCQQKKLVKQGQGYLTCWRWDLGVKRISWRRHGQHKSPEVRAYLAYLRKYKEAVWLEWVESGAVLWRIKSEK